jgi:hypothetical protein
VKVIRPSCNPCAVNQDIKRQQFAAMSDYSGSLSDHHIDIQPPKRKANQAGLDGHATGRSVKRRASKACQCCRSRKVRCNVTEHGAPCTNCRLDEVECIVSESRRKKLVPHFLAISDTSLLKHKHCFCLINDVTFCRHANSAEGSVFGLATCGASNLSLSRGAFQPMTTVSPDHIYASYSRLQEIW